MIMNGTTVSLILHVMTQISSKKWKQGSHELQHIGAAYLVAKDDKMRYFFSYICIKLTCMLITPSEKMLMLSCSRLLNSHPNNKQDQLLWDPATSWAPKNL